VKTEVWRSSTKSDILAFFLVAMNDAIFEAERHVSLEMKTVIA
jgi:hypothetical protein